jgi:hypothetical protein
MGKIEEWIRIKKHIAISLIAVKEFMIEALDEHLKIQK